MAILNTYQIIFSDTNLTEDNELVLIMPRSFADILFAVVNYNVTPTIENQVKSVRLNGSEVTIELSERIKGTHLVNLIYI